MLRPDADELGLWQGYPSSSEVLLSVLQGERMTSFFAGLLGGAVRGYDFVWLRHQPPQPRRRAALRPRLHGPRHARVLTCWTPFGDIPLGGGGLMLLEDSHRQSAVRDRRLPPPGRRQLLRNGPNADAVRDGTMRWEHWDRARARTRLGRRDRRGCRRAARGVGRALADRAAVPDGGRADLHHAHGPRGHRQRHDRLRLSTDCRYQRADAPVDERWVRRRERRAAGGPRRRREAREDLLMRLRPLGTTERECRRSVSARGRSAPTGATWRRTPRWRRCTRPPTPA